MKCCENTFSILALRVFRTLLSPYFTLRALTQHSSGLVPEGGFSTMYGGLSVTQHERLHSKGSAQISRDTTISQLWLPVKKRARFAMHPGANKDVASSPPAGPALHTHGKHGGSEQLAARDRPALAVNGNVGSVHATTLRDLCATSGALSPGEVAVVIYPLLQKLQADSGPAYASDSTGGARPVGASLSMRSVTLSLASDGQADVSIDPGAALASDADCHAPEEGREATAAQTRGDEQARSAASATWRVGMIALQLLLGCECARPGAEDIPDSSDAGPGPGSSACCPHGGSEEHAQRERPRCRGLVDGDSGQLPVLPAGVDFETIDFLMECLALDPDDRPPPAALLHHDIFGAARAEGGGQVASSLLITADAKACRGPERPSGVPPLAMAACVRGESAGGGHSVRERRPAACAPQTRQDKSLGVPERDFGCGGSGGGGADTDAALPMHAPRRHCSDAAAEERRCADSEALGALLGERATVPRETVRGAWDAHAGACPPCARQHPNSDGYDGCLQPTHADGTSEATPRATPRAEAGLQVPYDRCDRYERPDETGEQHMPASEWDTWQGRRTMSAEVAGVSCVRKRRAYLLSARPPS